MTQKEIENARALLDQLEAQKANEPKEPGWFDRVLESKHVDFLINTLQAALFVFISFYIPDIILSLFKNMSVQMAESIQSTSIAAFQFFVIILIVDTKLFFSENVIYSFLKRNGDHTFDFQESIKELSPFQKCIIAYLKYFSYMLLFALLLLT